MALAALTAPENILRHQYGHWYVSIIQTLDYIILGTNPELPTVTKTQNNRWYIP